MPAVRGDPGADDQEMSTARRLLVKELGVKPIEDRIWLVSFMRYDLGSFDHETCPIESAANPLW